MLAVVGRTSTPRTPTTSPPLTQSPSPGHPRVISPSQENGTQSLKLAFPPSLVQTVPLVQNIFDYTALL